MQLWEGICEFVAVAEQESFTCAATRMGISTAQVSRQVSQLEKRLGIKLFYRTTRKVTLTQEGIVHYKNCRHVLDNLEEAERALVQQQQSPKGKIRVSLPVSYGEAFILPLLNDFLLMYKEVELDISLSNRQVNLVEEGYDLAIRLGRLSDSSMMARKLSSRRFYVCASPGYLTKFGTPQRLADLEQHNCLLGTSDFWRFSDEGKERNLRVSGSLRCNSGAGLIDAAVKDIGVIQLPNYYVEAYLQTEALLPLLQEYTANDEGIWAIYPNNRLLSSRVSLLIEHLKQGISG